MRAALLPLVLLPLLGAAQSWCPPGATWTHEYADVLGGYFGVQRVVYVGDTVVGGSSAQRLNQTYVVAPWGSSTYSTYTMFSLFTRYDDGVVYIWDNNGAYDTLFWFGAVPGDHWSAPGWPDDGDITLTVVDTATVIMDGVPLRRSVVAPFNGQPIDTLYERIGGNFLYLNGFSWFLTDMPYSGLLCYSDQDMDYTAMGVSDCGYTLSVQDRPGAQSAVPFPNPGTTHFTLVSLPARTPSPSSMPRGAWCFNNAPPMPGQ